MWFITWSHHSQSCRIKHWLCSNSMTHNLRRLLSCECNNLPRIVWINSNNFRFEKKRSLICSLRDPWTSGWQCSEGTFSDSCWLCFGLIHLALHSLMPKEPTVFLKEIMWGYSLWCKESLEWFVVSVPHHLRYRLEANFTINIFQCLNWIWKSLHYHESFVLENRNNWEMLIERN